MTVWNIAHRGGAGLWPENSLPAFADAVARGCDGAELDVQLTVDGVVIVHHDFRLHAGYARDENGRWIEGPGPRIKDLTLEQLRRFDIGRAWPGGDYARTHPDQRAVDGTRIPTLAEALDAAKASTTFRLLVELKTNASEDSSDPIALADAALKVVEEAGFLDRALFIGFDWRGLARVKQKNPAARLWCDTDTDIPGTEELFGIIQSIGGEGWFPYYSQLTSQSVALARAQGLSLAAWTVNDQTEMRRLFGLGVDAICTDRPDMLADLL